MEVKWALDGQNRWETASTFIFRKKDSSQEYNLIYLIKFIINTKKIKNKSYLGFDGAGSRSLN